MKLVALAVAAASLLACSTEKKEDKVAKPKASPGARTEPPAKAPPKTTTPAEPPAPTASLPDATSKLVAALTPVADKIEEAVNHGCMEGADRVAALYDQADDAADDLHVMLRDASLRAQLQAAIKSRNDPALTKVLSRIDTNLIGCQQITEQAQKGMDRLLQPAIVVPQ